MARIAPSQLNEAMARIASRKNKTNSLDPNLPALISVSTLTFRVEEDWARKGVRCHHQSQPRRQSAQFDGQPSSNFSEPPCNAASFEVNSEPHTGARPSVRLCVGLIGSRRQAP
jgi:hypothetical protein